MKDIELRENCVIGVSGGADSMLLLYHYKNVKNIHVVHINYGIRDDSDEDELLVKEFCNKYEIPLHIEIHKLKGSSNLEAVAREIRYSYFKKIMSEFNLDHIITAHNSNDQAETLLMRILRGTGIRGLACIHRDSGTLFRPLLDWSKDEVYSRCKELDIPFREDSTNQDTSYLRNWFRHKYGIDSITNTAVNIADKVQDLIPKLEYMADEIYQDSIIEKDGNIWISSSLEPDMLFQLHLSNYISLPSHVYERMFSDDPSTRYFDISKNVRCNKKINNWIVIEIK